MRPATTLDPRAIRKKFLRAASTACLARWEIENREFEFDAYFLPPVAQGPLSERIRLDKKGGKCYAMFSFRDRLVVETGTARA